MRMGKAGAKIETSLQDALYETEWIMFDCVDALLNKTGVDPKEVISIPFPLEVVHLSQAAFVILTHALVLHVLVPVLSEACLE
jgi:FAE1/Type III polyketide synthase-like protein